MSATNTLPTVLTAALAIGLAVGPFGSTAVADERCKNEHLASKNQKAFLSANTNSGRGNGRERVTIYINDGQVTGTQCQTGLVGDDHAGNIPAADPLVYPEVRAERCVAGLGCTIMFIPGTVTATDPGNSPN
jgi:hypothetical protein